MTLSAFAQTGSPIVMTPFGESHADCVHEVPNGSTLVSPNTFQTPDGKILYFAGCSDPIAPSNYPSCFPPTNGAGASYTASATLGSISAVWSVPDNPSHPDSNDLFYLWDGLLGGSGTLGCAYVIQPVIQWGYNDLYGGAYYTMSSWYYATASDYYYSSPVGIYAGDSITGSAQSNYDCTNGVCSGWSLEISDATQNSQTGFTCANGGGNADHVCQNAYTTVTIDFEANDISSCTNDLPASPEVTFSSIYVHDTSGSDVSVSWTTATSTSCSYAVPSSSGGYPASVTLGW